MYPYIDDLAQSLLNEWESSRTRVKPRYTSMEQNMSGSVQNVADASPESSRRPDQNNELDDNGKRKRNFLLLIYLFFLLKFKPIFF